MKQNHESKVCLWNSFPLHLHLSMLRERCLWPFSGPGSQWRHRMAASEYRKTLRWCWTSACSGGQCSWPAWEIGTEKGRRGGGSGGEDFKFEFNFFFLFYRKWNMSSLCLNFVTKNTKFLTWAKTCYSSQTSFPEIPQGMDGRGITTSVTRILLVGAWTAATNRSKIEFMMITPPGSLPSV